MTAVSPSTPRKENGFGLIFIHAKKVYNLKGFELEQDYSDSVNTVQQHNVSNPTYCLRIRSDAT